MVKEYLIMEFMSKLFEMASIAVASGYTSAKFVDSIYTMFTEDDDDFYDDEDCDVSEKIKNKIDDLDKLIMDTKDEFDKIIGGNRV